MGDSLRGELREAVVGLVCGAWVDNPLVVGGERVEFLADGRVRVGDRVFVVSVEEEGSLSRDVLDGVLVRHVVQVHWLII